MRPIDFADRPALGSSRTHGIYLRRSGQRAVLVRRRQQRFAKAERGGPMSSEIHMDRELVVAGLCLAALVVRTGYELLKKRRRTWF